MLAIAAAEVLQLDVQTASLNVDIEGDVYVAKVPGFETSGGSPQAATLLNGLSGLPDSPMNWWNTIDPYR